MFVGSITALVTPFKEDFSIDWLVLDDLVEWHISAQTSALVINGTTGEAATLREQEKLAVLTRVLERAAGRIPVIAGTGSPSTAMTIKQVKQAAKLGAAAALVITPYYNRPTQEGLYQHYLAVANAVELPIIVYNVPRRTGCDLLPETLDRLASVQNIIGIKDATGDLDRVKAQQALSADRFIMLSGDDLTALDFMQAGGQGVISVAANALPLTMSLLCRAALSGQHAKALALQHQIVELLLALQAETNPITIKWLLAHMGKIENVLRLPLTPLAQPYHSLLAPWVARINLMEAQNANYVMAFEESTYV